MSFRPVSNVVKITLWVKYDEIVEGYGYLMSNDTILTFPFDDQSYQRAMISIKYSEYDYHWRFEAFVLTKDNTSTIFKIDYENEWNKVLPKIEYVPD